MSANSVLFVFPTHIINKSAGVGGGNGDPGKSALKTVDFTGFQGLAGPGPGLDAAPTVGS